MQQLVSDSLALAWIPLHPRLTDFHSHVAAAKSDRCSPLRNPLCPAISRPGNARLDNLAWVPRGMAVLCAKACAVVLASV